MKPIYTLAVLGALAAGPALAQEYPSGPTTGLQQGQVTAGAAEQAVQPEFLAQIQQQLQGQGIYDGPIDGVYGDQTKAALAQWQTQQGLQPTGQLNAQTLAAMDIDAMSTQQAETPQPQQEQQARQPGAAEEDAVEVDRLREEHMSSPNVPGEATPERPGTGVPAPGQSPESLDNPRD